jgi:hypothetical protein
MIDPILLVSHGFLRAVKYDWGKIVIDPRKWGLNGIQCWI